MPKAWPRLDVYKDTEPKLVMEDFFNGEIRGWGLIQGRNGRVITRFDVAMQASWNGDQGILNERFTYYDGTRQERGWKIRRLADGTYEGAAGDIIGPATARASGGAMRWTYSMDVPVGKNKFRLSFDDWMFHMNDGTIMNRSYLRKFGITVAQLTIFMQKKSHARSQSPE